MKKKTQRGKRSRKPAVATDSARAIALAEARLEDSFGFLGVQADTVGHFLRVFRPRAMTIEAQEIGGLERRWPLGRGEVDGLFCVAIADDPPLTYRLLCADSDGEQRVVHDPYRFGEIMTATEAHAWRQGRLWRAHDCLGAACKTIDGVSGCAFSVWAPRARRVAVVGDFNAWDNRIHGMRKRHEAGVWEIFIPDVQAGVRYKFDILAADGRRLDLKADPFARSAELRPANASIVAPSPSQEWRDGSWLQARADANHVSAPISIYEVHLGSWRRRADGGFLSYGEIANSLVPYVRDLGFTHVQLLPVTEHPYDPSWGYQTTGLFAPTSRFGTPEDFATFVERFHEAGIGVLCDFVPAHFPTDAFGLAAFDGEPLFEDANPKRGFHPDWNTCIYDWGRPQVLNFLVSSALFWFERFHIDGLRVDAVSSMLYLDYSRGPGEWEPNAYGGNINLEAVSFLQKLNEMSYGECPGIAMIAEESTAWPGVSKPTSQGGLGFGYKWNMGWMHDTLKYMQRDPIHRRWHHDEMTFGLVYAWSENFILALSHDEVVHGKGSLFQKMPGDAESKFANLRAYFAFMWAHPGKKLLFMGGEFAQSREWNHDSELDWSLLHDAQHDGVRELIRELNAFYRATPAMHQGDCDPSGFEWIRSDAREESILAFLRWDFQRTKPVLAIFNFTPIPRPASLFGVPLAGAWRVVLRSDLPGTTSERGSAAVTESQPVACDARAHSICVDIPPLCGLYLMLDEAVQ